MNSTIFSKSQNDELYRISPLIRLSFFPKGKTNILAKFHRTDLVICSHSREGKTPFYSQITMVSFIMKIFT